MIDPTNVTNFEQNNNELEEFILFWICAAGKNGQTAANCLDSLLNYWWIKLNCPRMSVFEMIREIDSRGVLPAELKRFGIGCYNYKAAYFRNIIAAGLDLKTCTVEQLESVKGIGPKTARCFIIHSRPRQRHAGLDRHILKELRALGHDVPKHTPTRKQYRRIEQIFLEIVKKRRTTVAKLDLAWWNKHRKVAQSHG